MESWKEHVGVHLFCCEQSSLLPPEQLLVFYLVFSNTAVQPLKVMGRESRLVVTNSNGNHLIQWQDLLRNVRGLPRCRAAN